MLPVCIKPGALGDGLPSRPLWVSPGHGLYIDGALVPAWLIVNGKSVVQAEAVGSVTYIHVEFEDHEIIYAEGVPAESFIDEQCRAQFQNAAEFAALYPEAESETRWTCAPRLEDGFHLEEIRQRFNARAGIDIPASVRGPLRGFVDQAGPMLIAGWGTMRVATRSPCLPGRSGWRSTAHADSGEPIPAGSSSSRPWEWQARVSVSPALAPFGNGLCGAFGRPSAVRTYRSGVIGGSLAAKADPGS